MIIYKDQIKAITENLVNARNIIFGQILNLAMDNELLPLADGFEAGDVYSWSLSHFETVEDINVQQLMQLCKKTDATIFSLMDLNGISENEVDLEGQS